MFNIIIWAFSVMSNEIQFILYQLPDEEGKVQVVNYDRKSPTTREFYRMVQNRFHYAITGQTAPEIIYTRAEHTKDHMGLQTWKNAPDGRVLLSDAKIAKNYLPEVEIRRLERAVSELPGRDRPETVERLYKELNQWLNA